MRPIPILAIMLAAAGCTGGYGATVPPDAGPRAAHPGGAAMTTQSEGKPFGPVVAGRFYPGSATELTEAVDGYLKGAKEVPLEGRLLGVVSPHAGYVYSGPTAGWAFRQLKGKSIEIAVVLAPSHRFRGDQAGVLDRPSYSTPAGDLAIARDDVAALLRTDRFTSNERLFSMEHSLEVQLPFLRAALPGVPIVPIVVPTHDPAVIRGIAKELHARFGKRRVVYVASSDMSHYKPYDENNAIDKATFSVMEKMSVEVLLKADVEGKAELCGLGPVAVLWAIAELAGGGTMTLLKHENSGDTAGDRSGVVGYGAVAVTVGGK